MPFFLKTQFLLFWERERGGGHDHTKPFSQKISSSSGKGKVWWPWWGLWKTSEALMAPGRCSFPKLLGGLILVPIPVIWVPIRVVLWKVVGQRGLCMTMTTVPSISQTKRRASQRKAVYDHDHHHFPFQKRRTSQVTKIRTKMRPPSNFGNEQRPGAI